MSSVQAVLSGTARWAVVLGDNLTVMRAMPPQSVHLVYADAPFMTGRDFETADGQLAYSDKWPSLDAFVDSVIECCAAARDLLTEDGCLILHVDPRTSHYLKVALDRLFGRECFRNEIVWRYRRWPTASPNFQRMHDVLLRYTRRPKKERWNQLYEPLSPSTLAIHGTKKQRHAITEGGRKWGDHAGYSSDDSPGAYLSDVWDISLVAPLSAARTGYPTEKPAALLERVVLSCSHVGDVVLEPYAGSAPAVERAVAHGRRGIAIDQSQAAIDIIRERVDGPLFRAAVG